MKGLKFNFDLFGDLQPFMGYNISIFFNFHHIAQFIFEVTEEDLWVSDDMAITEG